MKKTNINLFQTIPTYEIYLITIFFGFLTVCGRRLFPSARIVGGEKVAFGKWPWQVSP